jgi:hypothetical protein
MLSLCYVKGRIVIEHPGGCYTSRYFGERRDPAVWCAKPGGEHVRSQADRGCAFWQREPGADDALQTDLRIRPAPAEPVRRNCLSVAQRKADI